MAECSVTSTSFSHGFFGPDFGSVSDPGRDFRFGFASSGLETDLGFGGADPSTRIVCRRTSGLDADPENGFG